MWIYLVSHNIVIIFAAMPRLAHKKYDTVEVLPVGAMSVKKFAESIGISTSLFYHRIDRKVANYKIVIYNGYNFVLPK